MTLIFGKESNLSQEISNSLDNTVLISIRDFLKNPSILDKYKSMNINLIFNNFQTSTALNTFADPEKYISQSIYATSLVLEKVKSFMVQKIIYTSSSSVYGNNELCVESDTLMPLSLHASLKLANEHLIIKFCSYHGIDYTIVRLFNMFGGNDHFSVISKIIHAFKTNKEITLINNGKGIRDYIHIDDVVHIYKKLLKFRSLPIVNVGTGNNNSLENILSYLKKHGYEIKINNIQKEEINISIADKHLLEKNIGKTKFKEVEKYILEQILDCK